LIPATSDLIIPNRFAKATCDALNEWFFFQFTGQLVAQLGEVTDNTPKKT